jgi:hypothetical protein
MSTTQPLTAHEVRCLSVEALCDPRSTTRWLAGLPVKQLTEKRLAEAAKRLGRLDLLSPARRRGAWKYPTPGDHGEGRAPRSPRAAVPMRKERAP